MITRSAKGRIEVVKHEADVVADAEEADAHTSSGGADVDVAQVVEEAVVKPPKKKQRPLASEPTRRSVKDETDKKQKKPRGKNVGKLSKLLDMPVDIFCEITAHLEPLDVLRLARSTRDFNSMLMSRSSRPIWRAARAAYPDLPPCPPDLSEPAYARLLFEKDCHACLAPRTFKVDWVLRSRLCHRCRPNLIIRGNVLLKAYPDLTEELLHCIPCRNNLWAGSRRRRMESFYGGSVEALLARYRAAVPQGLPEDEAETRREEFIQRQKESVLLISEHAEKVNEWIENGRLSKMQQGDMAVNRRQAELHKRLMELGYEEADFPMSSEPDWYQIMNQPRDLTPQIWAKARPKLEACIQRAKEERAKIERNARKADRRAELSVHVNRVVTARNERDPRLYMQISNVWKLHTVDAILSEDDFKVPITEARWSEVKDQVEKEMDEFSEDVVSRLIKKINERKDELRGIEDNDKNVAQSSTPSSVDRDYLESHSTFFDCEGSSLQYPQMLTYTHGWGAAWNPEVFKFDELRTLYAETLLASMRGLSGWRPSAKAPQQDFPDSSIMTSSFQCLRCDQPSFPMDWPALVVHYTREDYGARQDARSAAGARYANDITHSTRHNIRAKSRPLARIILTREEAHIQREKAAASKGTHKEHKCGICDWGGEKTREEVTTHVQHEHSKDFPDDGDIVRLVKHNPDKHMAFYF
ncbi:hypothetical protein JB92DRAFT_2929793 [Gautieria morchelliformis]|nr:hypothetical protein JB92DRAFT_2929793 [Gautieria morchelliformis]